MENSINPTLDSVDNEIVGSEARARLQADYAAVSPEQFLQVKLEIPAAAVTVLGALPEIRNLRPDLEKIRDYDLALFDKLEDAAIALRDIHGDYLTATRPADALEQLVEEGTILRERMVADASALATRGVVNEESLSELKGPVGYKNLGMDLTLLVKVFRARWPQIEGKSAVTQAELNRADRLSVRLTRLVGLREESPEAVAEVTELRLRAFTFFMRVYDHVRRGVAYVRWDQDDSEQIAPSLYAGRGGRRKGTDALTAAGAVVPTTTTTTAASGTTGTAGAGAGAAGGPATGAAPATPGTDPFMS